MARPSWDATKNRNGIGLNFMWNCQLWPDKGGPVKYPSGIRSPSRLAMTADCAYAGYVEGYFAWGYITRQRNGVPVDVNNAVQLNSYGTNAYRHRNSCILGFADGHVAAYTDVVAANTSGDITTVAKQ